MEMGHHLEVVRIETVQIVTDPSKIDDSLFEIKLPRDAHVYHADAKMVLRNSEQV